MASKTRNDGASESPCSQKNGSIGQAALLSEASQECKAVRQGARMPVNAILDYFDYGVTVAEIADQFEIEVDRIGAVLIYARNRRVAHRVWQDRV